MFSGVRNPRRRQIMGLTMKDRKAISQELAARDQRARKKGCRRMLDQFVQLTHYRGPYASFLLAN